VKLPWWHPRRWVEAIALIAGADACPTDGRPHDYHFANGGDGVPQHFCKYRCWKCGRRFSI
jgi:hypothetical protein